MDVDLHHAKSRPYIGMAARDDIDSLNKNFYLSKTAASWYAEKEFVLPEEQAFLREYGEAIRGGRVLDIGIGAGRSTRYLIPLAGSYVGVDYSPDMVREAAEHFPGAQIEERDARDLSAYAAGEFDFVMFSFNGMDCLSHEGRMQTLAEVRRVLKPGGIFAFSAHNRDRPKVVPYSIRYLNRSKHPVRMAKNVWQFIEGIRDWRRSLHCAVDEPEYALRHDSGNFFKVPMYYISKQAQVAQLERLGFVPEVIYDGHGQHAKAEDVDPVSSWIFYVCRKSA